ncbi:23736_t:CDS:1, partial [Racocetra persica]
KTRSLAKNRSESSISEKSTETIAAPGSQERQDTTTDIEARMKEYVDVAIQATIAALIRNMQQYIDRQAETQRE